MGIQEEVGQTARGAIEALKNNPGLLVVVILQVATTAIVYFNAKALNEYRHEREMLMLNRCLKDQPYPGPPYKPGAFLLDPLGTAAITP